MVRKGNRRRVQPKRRQRRGLQSHVQRLKTGRISRGRLPADPPARQMSMFRSGTVELRIQNGAASASFSGGSPTEPGQLAQLANVTSFNISSDNLEELLINQLLGYKKGDLVAGTLQYAISSISAWSSRDYDDISVTWLFPLPQFPRMVVRDVGNNMHKARVKLVLPMAVWSLDSATSVPLTNIRISAANTAGGNVATVRIAVRYAIIAIATQ